MNETITFSGISLTPDEYNVQNGELAICANLENHDGGMRPIQLNGTASAPLQLTEGQPLQLLYVHETAGVERRFITTDDHNTLYWFHEDGFHDSSPTIYAFGEATVNAINSVGNTLVISASDGIHYALWKDGTYHYIGQKPPFLKLAFTLAGDTSARDVTDFSAKYDQSTLTEVTGDETEYTEAWRQTTLNVDDVLSLKNNNSTVTLKAEAQAIVTEATWALLNETNNIVAKQGHFYAPFFVRYCYRLYDGSMIMHSAPVFMQTAMPHPFTVYLANCYTESGTIHINSGEIVVKHSSRTPTFKFNKLTLLYTPSNVELQYRLENPGQLTQLRENWSDIVQSVDIFITPPVTPYNSAEKITSAVNENNRIFFPTSYNDFSNQQYRLLQTSTGGVTVKKTTVLPKTAAFTSRDGTKAINVAIDIPAMSYQTFTEKRMNQPAFFRLKSLPVQDAMNTDFGSLEADATVVENIATQTQMTDDYHSHNHLTAEGLFVYNHRVHLYGITETLFGGFDINQLTPPLQKGPRANDTGYTIDGIAVILQTEQGEKTVMMNHDGGSYDLDTTALYFFNNLPLFYPDARAKKMIIKGQKEGIAFCFAKEMFPCAELNGAMTKPGSFYGNDSTLDETSWPESTDNTVTLPNYIYTSEINDPFYFPPKGINAVGLGQILGLATTTRALSQGQFGQFPLMAFASDGVWAMNVSSTGLFSSIHPISRLVCSNPTSITQLDQSAVFVTARAVYQLVESQTRSISDALDGPYKRLPSDMSEITAVINTLPQAAASALNIIIQQEAAPIEQFQSASIIYDYTASRLIVTTPEADTPTMAWVYALGNGTWTTMLMPAHKKIINGYPYPFIQQADGSVLRLDKKYDYTDTTKTPGLLLTRTLKLDGIIKVITGLQQLASSEAENTPTIFIYGSDDNRHWHYLGHSNRRRNAFLPGQAWRFFRLAVLTNMKADEQLVATQLAYIEKYSNF